MQFEVAKHTVFLSIRKVSISFELSDSFFELSNSISGNYRYSTSSCRSISPFIRVFCKNALHLFKKKKLYIVKKNTHTHTRKNCFHFSDIIHNKCLPPYWWSFQQNLNVAQCLLMIYFTSETPGSTIKLGKWKLNTTSMLHAYLLSVSFNLEGANQRYTCEPHLKAKSLNQFY